MDEPFVKLDLHGMNLTEAEKAVDKAISVAGPGTYQIMVIHGFNRGSALKNMICEEFRYDKRIKRIMPGDNQGVTILVLKELY